MIAILWVKVLIFQGAKPIFNVGSLSYFSIWIYVISIFIKYQVLK